MWTRKELKQQGNAAFKNNYWRCVIVALILSIIAGGSAGITWKGGGFKGFNSSSFSKPKADINLNGKDYDIDDLDDLGDEIEDALEDDLDYDFDEDDFGDMMEEGFKDAFSGISAAAIVVGVIIFLIIFLIVFAIVFALTIFIFNPLTVGGTRFFVKNLQEKATVSHLGYSFDNNYKNIVLTMFLRDLYIFLWSLLLIIPGIVKAYEYRMIPYLLTDDPTLTREQAFQISKKMMDGHKWNAFVLDLSFIGWHILGAMTFGILEIFYVAPYQYSTNAALYRKLLWLSQPGGGYDPNNYYGQPQPGYGAPNGYYTQPGAPYGQNPQPGAYAQPMQPAPMPEEQKVYWGQPDFNQPEYTKYDNVQSAPVVNKAPEVQINNNVQDVPADPAQNIQTADTQSTVQDTEQNNQPADNQDTSDGNGQQ